MTVVLWLIGACSPPPGPSPETAALEGSLLTLEDVRGDYVEEYRGSVGVSGGAVCPESDFEFDDVGMVRAVFVRDLEEDNEVELVEMVRVAEPGELDVLFPALKSAAEACSGVTWTDYGDTQMIEILPAPELGADRIAVLARHGDPPFDERHDYVRTLYTRTGEIFVEMSVAERLDESGQEPTVSDEEFMALAASAIALLPTR